MRVVEDDNVLEANVAVSTQQIEGFADDGDARQLLQLTVFNMLTCLLLAVTHQLEYSHFQTLMDELLSPRLTRSPWLAIRELRDSSPKASTVLPVYGMVVQ